MKGEHEKMITKKLKSLAVVLACIMTLGTMPPSTGSGNFLPVTTTVEAATKTINLKASNKKSLCWKDHEDLSKSYQRGKAQLQDFQ